MALVQLRHPEMTLADWQGRVGKLQEIGGGVAAVESERGYLYGVMVYETDAETSGNRVLHVTDMVTLTLTGGENARSLLLDWSENRARELRCDRMEIDLH